MMHRKELPPMLELNGRINSSPSFPDNGKLKSRDCASDDVTCKTKPPSKRKPFLGFIYVILTSLLLTFIPVFVKKLSYIDPGQLSAVRNAGILAGCIPIAIYSVKEVFGPRKDRMALLLRGLFAAIGMYFHPMAFRYLPLAEAAILMSTTPAVTTIIARVYLKESCGRVQVLSLLLTFCGVILSLRLPELMKEKNRRGIQFDFEYLGGLASAMGCVLFLSLASVLLRKMKNIHFSVPLLYFGLLGTIGNGVVSFSIAPLVYPNCRWDQIFVLLIGILGFLGHCTLTLSFQVEAAGIVSVIKSSMDIVIAMIFQIIIFSADLDAYNISGACLVMVSASIIGLSKWIQTLPEECKARNKLKFLLL